MTAPIAAKAPTVGEVKTARPALRSRPVPSLRMHSQILALQRTAGNEAVSALVKAPGSAVEMEEATRRSMEAL